MLRKDKIILEALKYIIERICEVNKQNPPKVYHDLNKLMKEEE